MKKHELNITARLSLSFFLEILILIIFFIVFFIDINNFSRSLNNLYMHPFTVSNASKEIQINIIKIQSIMKDLVITEDYDSIKFYSEQIDELEAAIFDDLAVISEKYLGKKSDVDNLYKTVSNWRTIRIHAIDSKLSGDEATAVSIVQSQSERHLNFLETEIRNIVNFAENKAEEFYNEALQKRRAIIRLLLVFFLAAAGIAVLIAVYSILRITRPLLNIVSWIGEIAEGKLDSPVELRYKDEIGALAESCLSMQQNLRHKSEIAVRISRGDFSGRVEIRAPEDIVGQSINLIADNYSRIVAEYDYQNWLKTGQNIVNESMQGDLDLENFSRNVISGLCTHIDAQIGAFYLADTDREELRLTGGYALNLSEGNTPVPFGKGLSGQCAVEKRTITFTGLPDDFFRICAGTGECNPVSVVAFPIRHEGRLTAVVEIGSIRTFGEKEFEFIENIGGAIGLSLHSVLITEQTARLLRETQRQSAELAQQQEELQETNEKLEKHSLALKDSESILQQQQEELRATNEELEEKTEELKQQRDELDLKNTELDKALSEISAKAEELEKSSSYKSEFLANMSHELRTPLNSIIILSNLLSRNEENPLTEKQREFAETIYSSGTDLLNLIDEILDLSKIEAGRMELIKETVSPEQIVSSLNIGFRQLAEEKGIEFNIHIDKGVPKQIYTDIIRIKQILKNLLSNAFKFTHKGKIELRIYNHNKDTVAFAVSDTGIGIDEEKKDIIFEAFKQADGTTNRQFGGTGLGLSISLELAEILGGKLEMESEPGKGSVFTLFLPNKIKDSSKGPATTAEEHDAKSGTEKVLMDDRDIIKPEDRSILIIEDDSAFAEVVLDFARKHDFKGIIAPDGETGLHFADYYSPSAIILDVRLPGIDGWEVMNKLKSNETTRYIPVHFITIDDNQLTAMKLGAVGFLLKPVTSEMLQSSFERIESIISGKMKNLLLVEDDETERHVIKELLEGKDLQIFEAGSGEEGLEKIREYHLDCIVLDLGLQDMSGFHFLDEMRKLKSDIPVVVYTGRALTEDERIELERHSEAVIIKSARSQERLFEETALFLHRIESELPEEKQKKIKIIREKNSILKDKKILIVDDDMRNVFALSGILEENGVQIIAGKNGEDGLKKLEEFPDIDLVLMDIMMPVMDGYEAINKIRSKPEFKKLPVIALTAKAMKGDRNKCIEAGADDYLSKPVEVDKLLSLLRVWLHG